VPTYAYRCTACGNEFDIYQRFDEASLTNCPACDAPLRKLFSPTGIVFKGSGFYRTDSRTESKSPATESRTTRTKPGGTSTTADRAASPAAG